MAAGPVERVVRPQLMSMPKCCSEASRFATTDLCRVPTRDVTFAAGATKRKQRREEREHGEHQAGPPPWATRWCELCMWEDTALFAVRPAG
jgi:hypothetical protein